mmetsp:Transcript_21510/g.54592  ORF Transcript_21510/g.54592 Transcript_21510/m.54592 type:complete len:200 (-) Transcript_21510:267-866(-)
MVTDCQPPCRSRCHARPRTPTRRQLRLSTRLQPCPGRSSSWARSRPPISWLRYLAMWTRSTALPTARSHSGCTSRTQPSAARSSGRARRFWPSSDGLRTRRRTRRRTPRPSSELWVRQLHRWRFRSPRRATRCRVRERRTSWRQPRRRRASTPNLKICARRLPAPLRKLNAQRRPRCNFVQSWSMRARGTWRLRTSLGG